MQAENGPAARGLIPRSGAMRSIEPGSSSSKPISTFRVRAARAPE